MAEKKEKKPLEDLRQEIKAKKLQERKASMKTYQSRTREKKKFLLAAVKFIQRLYVAHPKNMSLNQIRHIHISAAHIMRLRRGWTPTDLQRAWNELRKLENEVWNGKYAKYSAEYQRLYTAVMEPMTNMTATVDERADVVKEALTYVAKEMSGEYGDKRPETSDAPMIALMGMTVPHPAWFPEAMADYLFRNMTVNEAIMLSNRLYDRIVEEQKSVGGDVFDRFEEDTTDEMVISAGSGGKGHTLG